MRNLILFSLLFYCFNGFSQEKPLNYNRPFVIFEGCDKDDDKEKCFVKNSSKFIYENLSDSLKSRFIAKAKKDTITLSARFYFDEKGSILTKESYILSSVDSTNKNLKFIVSKFPSVKPVLDEFNQGVASFVNAFYGYKIDSTKTQLKPILNFEPTEVPFQLLGKFPVFDGCNKDSENEELHKCMNKNLMNYIQKNFRSDVILSIAGLPEGINSIFLFFKIDKDGKIIANGVRAPHPILRQEGYRLIENMPNALSPGKIDGKAVSVPYFLPIKFVVEGSEKEERKKKKRKRKRRS